MILEMQSALEEATQRFNETASAMRATAKEVGSELEATRSELARGVMELPEETKSSAAAMRRVVAEQIEALAELNAIVRSQPATHDLNERRPPAAPTRQSIARDEVPASRPEPRPEPVRPEPARVETPRVEARAAETRVIETPRPRFVPMPDVPTPAPVAATPRPQPAPVEAKVAAPAPAPAAAKAEDGGGWLRDVLRNASGPTAPAAAQPVPAAPAAAPQPQNLNTLTDEIARSMDQAALAEAWQRYQAGEQNVFSRRIYTLTGQATYDEVRKRIQRDQDFARTAATYMAEFEQLLKRAATGSDPAGETREYLLSDRGRVYTMLAHASGRLG